MYKLYPPAPAGALVVGGSVLGFQDQGSGSKIQGPGFRVPGYRFRVSGFRIGILGFGVQVPAFRLRVESSRDLGHTAFRRAGQSRRRIRFRAKREPLSRFKGISPTSHGHNLAITVVHVPYSLDTYVPLYMPYSSDTCVSLCVPHSLAVRQTHTACRRAGPSRRHISFQSKREKNQWF